MIVGSTQRSLGLATCFSTAHRIAMGILPTERQLGQAVPVPQRYIKRRPVAHVHAWQSSKASSVAAWRPFARPQKNHRSRKKGKNNNSHDANLEAEVGEIAALVLGARVAHVTVLVDVYHVVHHVVVGSEGEQEPDHQKVCQSERCMEQMNDGW